MTTIPAVQIWNLSHYARRRRSSTQSKTHEYSWSYLDANRTPLKMILTPSFQLIVLSSEQCIEEVIDIWLLLSCTYVYVHRQSLLFRYSYPSNLRRIRYFRVKFVDEKDLNSCLKVLKEYFPVKEEDQPASEPSRVQSIFFQTMKDTLAFDQSTTMNLRQDFIRQYLSTCLIDPAFSALVNTNEQILKKLLREK